MEGIKMKKDGFISWSYKWITTRKELPKSFCQLFWMTLLSWVFMVILSPGLLLTLLSKSCRKDQSKYNVFLSFFTTVILGNVIFILFGLYQYEYSLYQYEYSLTNILQTLIEFGVVMAFLSIVVYVVYVVYNWIDSYLFEYRMKRMDNKKIESIRIKSDMEKKRFKFKTPKWLKSLVSFLKIGFDSFINKYCPKVDWG